MPLWRTTSPLTLIISCSLKSSRSVAAWTYSTTMRPPVAVAGFLCPALESSLQMTRRHVPRQLRRAYVSLHTRSLSGTPSRLSTSQFRRSDFANQPFTGSYEPGLPTSGPLAGASSRPQRDLTPRTLKQHLDQFVVGQERAKKILSVAVYNHYQRIQELQRREDEEEEMLAQKERRERHPVETEFPGQQPTIRMGGPATGHIRPSPPQPLIDTTPLTIEKSNILLLGPSGVGKTLMAKTLARVLSVPFSMSDCTPFTQAGYIGEDAEVCVHRLLAAANYDVEAAERGIICLDEIDKIATAKVSHGKDVSGEGVQQALLKIIEGTMVQIQAKPERNAPRAGGQSQTYPTNSPLGAGAQPAKGEVYNVRTDNILFICSGAFVGLQKHIMDRLAKGSIGFGARVSRPSGSGLLQASKDQKSTTSKPIPILPGSEEEALYKKHLPFFTPAPHPEQLSADGTPTEPNYFNPLDLLTPADLQSYGFIPELIGRIPVTAAVAPLTHNLLFRILTEPRSSLLAQYIALFSLSGIELRFTTPALHIVASHALAMGTGARALRTEMETILGDAMYEAPGSSVKYALVTENVAKREEGVFYFGRGQVGSFHTMIADEEGAWEASQRRNNGSPDDEPVVSFEHWRTKTTAAAGSGGWVKSRCWTWSIPMRLITMMRYIDHGRPLITSFLYLRWCRVGLALARVAGASIEFIGKLATNAFPIWRLPKSDMEAIKSFRENAREYSCVVCQCPGRWIFNVPASPKPIEPSLLRSQTKPSCIPEPEEQSQFTTTSSPSCSLPRKPMCDSQISIHCLISSPILARAKSSLDSNTTNHVRPPLLVHVRQPCIQLFLYDEVSPSAMLTRDSKQHRDYRISRDLFGIELNFRDQASISRPVSS